MNDIASWLERLGLGKYAELFAENDIDFEVLPHLREAHLESLPISLGHRIKLLQAIKALSNTETVATVQIQADESHDRAPIEIVRPPTVVPDTPAVQASDAERRPLTVMFCDLADSTKLSTMLDPEDLQEVIRAYQDACTRIILEYEGFVAKYMGDGILVYFGYPKSLERNAERAVRTGLAIVEAMAELNHTLGRDKDIEIAVRIGISTGIVMVGEVVGEGTARERTVIGEAPNIAARLQNLAGRDGIVISSLTKELTGDDFDYDDLGTHELKGVSGLVPTWGVIGLRSESTYEVGQDETDSTTTAPQLIGRDEETGLLRRAWQSTREERRGQIVTISGEAGIGKSVLVDGLRAEVRAEGLAVITFRCSHYHTGSALYPLIEHFKRLAGWQPEDDVVARVNKLESALEPYDQPLSEIVPLLSSLLSLPLPEDRYPPLAFTPQQQKQQTQDAIIALALEEAEGRPLLQLWEDLHWADPSTLELLSLLIEQAPTSSLLMVLTARPEFVPPWPARSHITPITLNRLERSHAEALLARVAGMKPLPAEVVDHIVSKTDGVPLYVEELTKTILTSDILRDTGERFELTGPLSALTIPDTLQESLMARLDRLPQVRKIAQLGSVLGREFAYELITGLSTISDTILQEGLGQLVEAELLYQRGRPPRAKYIFKHALIQDAAYQSLLKRPRQQYHLQVAQLLENRFPDTVEANPELVAHHYTEAGATEQAVAYWLKAGRRAAQQSAYPEAITHLRQGLAMLATIAETPERARLELTFQRTLGPVVATTQGYASPETKQIYYRSRELCQLVGETEDICPVLFGVFLFETGRAHHQRAIDVAKEILKHARHVQDSGGHIAGQIALGVSLVHTGQQSPARQEIEQIIALYDPQKHQPLAFRYGLEFGTTASAYYAWNLWLLGYPDQALEYGRQTLALLDKIKHPYSESRCHYWNAVLHAFREEWSIVHERAADAMKSAGEHGFELVLAAGQIMQGAATAAIGQRSVGLRQIRDGLDAYRATGGLFHGTYYLAMLALALNKEGLPEEGIEVLQDAADLVETTGERYYEAEIYRLKGELLLSASPRAFIEAEACYQQALDVARQQEAKSLELRAATSLAHLWREHDKQREAQELLVQAYEWFTEGFDTTDLKNARVLLDELA